MFLMVWKQNAAYWGRTQHIRAFNCVLSFKRFADTKSSNSSLMLWASLKKSEDRRESNRISLYLQCFIWKNQGSGWSSQLCNKCRNSIVCRLPRGPFLSHTSQICSFSKVFIWFPHMFSYPGPCRALWLTLRVAPSRSADAGSPKHPMRLCRFERHGCRPLYLLMLRCLPLSPMKEETGRPPGLWLHSPAGTWCTAI